MARDTDLKLMLKQGEKFIIKEIEALEALVMEHSIASPLKPPVNPVTITGAEVVTDRYIYRTVFEGIQSLLPILTYAFSHCVSPSIRTMFESFVVNEMRVYSEQPSP